ncbi:cytochrome-c oxidase, cbb3-type subunit II [Salinispirillum sp. LH 10-3-1]|uniref:Cytochrome-c oxidase, cbb3-type subunit II n=1 Tax=Salinispirillum sp. LH 10-3-1 TaxID=2952525 RepID=A0AB38YD68_9GAMM
MQHEKIEKNLGLMVVLVVIAISFGGLVEIVPLIASDRDRQPAEGLEPFTALQLEGRDIYIREGCHVCHTQMIRPLRAEVERYGSGQHFSTTEDFVYDHPFLWGSKRTGPDLAMVGGRYSDEWHRAHFYNPRDVVPESNMPSYEWLFDRELDGRHTAQKMIALRRLGVPYTDEQIANAADEVRGVREVDALIAYIQNLGTWKTSAGQNN